MLKRNLILSTVTLIIVGLFVTIEAMAVGELPRICGQEAGQIGNPYTIEVLTVSNNGVTTYDYEIRASKSDINKIDQVTGVVLRPIAPSDITIPAAAAVGNYCEIHLETKINKGACDSFAITIATQSNTDISKLFSVAATTATQGTVTFTIRKGNGDNHTCIFPQGATNGGQGPFLSDRGILGPGSEFDPNAPVAMSTLFNVGICSVEVTRDALGNVIAVELAPGSPPSCIVENPGGSDIATYLVLGLTGGVDRAVTNIPDGTSITSTASPSCYDFFFGGRFYRICS